MTKHNHVTRENKPQEFWIRFLTGDNYSTHQITDVSMNKLTDVPYEHDYHVIEYSAYEKLQQENERLTQALEVAEKALKYMTEEYDCDPEDVAIYDKRKAEEALEQIAKIKKGEL